MLPIFVTLNKFHFLSGKKDEKEETKKEKTRKSGNGNALTAPMCHCYSVQLTHVVVFLECCAVC